MDNKLTVATHNGGFHSDEVFAIAVLKEIYPDINIIRTRDFEILKTADIRVDVGGKYSFETKDFDHHQKDFNERRKNGIPYSSLGLIWKHYGMKLCNSEKVQEMIDERLIQFIDAGDSGVEYSNKKMYVYTVGSVIETLFSPQWDERGKEDEKFLEAVEFARKIIRKELENGKKIEEGEKLVEEAINNREEKEYVILNKRGLPKRPLTKDKDLKFVLSPRMGEEWTIESVYTGNQSGFERRMYFPKEWAGLTNEKLDEKIGEKGGVFCHKGLFITVAKNKEIAIRLVKKALEIRNTEHPIK